MIILALISFAYIVIQIRNKTLTIRDSLFWVFFSLLLILMAGFPQVVGFFSRLFGIETASNLVYIIIIGLMITRIYKLSIIVSTLDTKIKELTQSLAIQEYESEKRSKNQDK